MHRKQAITWICSLILLAGAGVGSVAAAETQSSSSSASKVSFNRDIRTLLSDNCFACHGPDENQRKRGLRLDKAEVAYSELKSGKRAIVPGKPEQSELIRRINESDPDERMPPPEEGKSLSAEQKDLLRRWIDQGAEYQKHWAFIPPKRPEIPEVKNQSWPRNPIDYFVLNRLEEKGLEPNPEADKTTLIRRANFDLTGLPPTPEEIDAYLANDNPKAYNELVDRLLASPQYGEHKARYWLDAARYADTHGYHIDAERVMWRYRDWVIDAFNQNKSFDEFTIEQLAGDLLPEPTMQQKIASGFNRCNMSTGEGGAIPEEYKVKYGVDRVDTTSTIWLGLTTACAQCHDHKFDPITQKEYYEFFAFFNSLDEQVMDGNQPNPDPFIKAPTERQKEQLASLEKEIAAATQRVNAPMPEVDAAQQEWLAQWDHKMKEQWESLDPVSFESTGPSNLRELDDGSLLAEGENPDTDVYEVVTETGLNSIGVVRLEALTHDSLPHKGAGRADNANFVLSELEVAAAPLGQDDAEFKPVEWMSAKADYSQSDFGIAKAIDQDPKTGWAVDGNKRRENRVAWFIPTEPIQFKKGARLRFRLRFESDVNNHAIGRFRLAVGRDSREWRDLMPTDSGPWHVIGPFKAEDGKLAFHTAYGPEKDIDLKQSYREGELTWETQSDFEDGKVQELTGENAATYLYRVITAPSEREITLSLGSDDAIKLWLNQEVVLDKDVQRGVEADQETVTVQLQPGKNHLLLKVVNYSGGYAFYYKKTGEDTGGIPFSILATLSQPADQRSNEEQKELRDYYRRKHSPEWRAKAEELAALQEEKKKLNDRIPTTLVSKEMNDPMGTHILKRGEYDKPGAEVSPGVPSILPSLPQHEGSPDRLTLAKWLVNPNHPLTARVTVNRYWQQYFGQGLVKTSEDFGTQGDSPTHPELLDWLATEFIRSGWNIKHIHRLIVTSATYRQSSKVSPQLQARDPQNRLLARGPRFRMDAEMIRDNALAVSGLLVPKVGGPSVKPYQPPGLWKAVSYGFNQIYQPDEGEARFRRSLYTFWKRQSAPPNLTTFDAPSRETCTVKRSRTNTPLQALVLMNDPQFVVASRAFAKRIMQEAGPDPVDRVNRAFRLATARYPSQQEREILVDYFKEQLAEYEQNPEKAKELVTADEMEQPYDVSLPTSEWAAWTTVANLILNLDETITKS